jgi:hypothetical protein
MKLIPSLGDKFSKLEQLELRDIVLSLVEDGSNVFFKNEYIKSTYAIIKIFLKINLRCEP